MAGITKYTDESWKKTNADKIREMTDEELADLLHNWWLGDTDYFKTYCFECKEKYFCHDDCLLDWLKQEAE